MRVKRKKLTQRRGWRDGEEEGRGKNASPQDRGKKEETWSFLRAENVNQATLTHTSSSDFASIDTQASLYSMYPSSPSSFALSSLLLLLPVTRKQWTLDIG